MKTVFLNGLMPGRSRALIRALCREFIVVGTGYQIINDDPDINVIEPSDIVGEFDFAGNQEFLKNIVSQSEILSENLSRDVSISPLGPAPGWVMSQEKQSQMILPKVAHLLHQAQVFREFHKQQPVHMLISGADYSSHSRPIVLAARKLNVPTLDIEHGFFFSMLYSDFRPDEGRMPILFSSEYVNLDNELEVSLISDRLDSCPAISPQLLSLGTPALTVANEAPEKQVAMQSLGLDSSRQQVLLLGSWIEARMVGSLISGQLDTIKLYKDLFSSLARNKMGKEIDLMIKLHPADCTLQVLPHVTACLLDLAHQAGLPAPTIYTDRLAEILGAADVVLSISWTSVLWDAFLMDKPAVIVPPNYLTESLKPGWREKGNIPLSEAVVRAAENADEAWSFVNECLAPGYREIHAEKCLSMRRKYNLVDKSVEQKSQDICDWVVNFSKTN